jgi:hypothetical protein
MAYEICFLTRFLHVSVTDVEVLLVLLLRSRYCIESIGAVDMGADSLVNAVFF